MTEPAVRVVLDASAIIAFTRGSSDVGEVIAEVADEASRPSRVRPAARTRANRYREASTRARTAAMVSSGLAVGTSWRSFVSTVGALARSPSVGRLRASQSAFPAT